MTKVTPRARLKVRERLNEIPIIHQDWRDMLFLHWKYDPEKIQKTLPAGLYVDTFKNDGYLTILPFFISNVQVGGFPSLPGLSNFIEVNVRTYVYDENGIPGIWFYSLDLNGAITANMARQAFSFPYFFAELTSSESKNALTISGKRIDKPHLEMEFSYARNQKNQITEEGTLEFFLLERYVAYALRGKELYYNFINHEPYQMHEADVLSCRQAFWQSNGFLLSEKEFDYAHFSPGVNVDFYRPKKTVIYKEDKNDSAHKS